MIEISRLSGSIHACQPVKRTAPSENSDGLLEKRLTLRVQVGEHLDDIIGAFPGADLVVKATSGEEHPGVVIKSRRHALDVTMTLCDPTGAKIMDPLVVRASAPTLTIGHGGKDVAMQVVVQGVFPKDTARTLDDYFRADILVSLVPTQSDIEDAAKKTTRRKKKAAPVETVGEQTDIGDLTH